MGVWAWGAGGKGQLGCGNLEDSPSARPLASLRAQDLAGVAAGGSHALALLKCGAVLAWGCGHDGALGLGEIHPTGAAAAEGPSAPAEDPGAGPSVSPWQWPPSVRQTEQGACVPLPTPVPLFSSHLPSPMGSPCPLPSPYSPLEGSRLRVVKAAAGWSHSMFLTECGRVLSCGDNSQGQLGLGREVASAHTPHPVLLPLSLGQDRAECPSTACSKEALMRRPDPPQCSSSGAGCGAGHLAAGSNLREGGQGGEGAGAAVLRRREGAPAADDACLCHQLVATDVVCGRHHTLVLARAGSSGAQPYLLGWGASRHGQLGPCTLKPDDGRGPASADEAVMGGDRQGSAAPADRAARRQQRPCAWTPQRLLHPQEPTAGASDASRLEPEPQPGEEMYQSIAAGGDQSAAILGSGQLLLWGRVWGTRRCLQPMQGSHEPGTPLCGALEGEEGAVPQGPVLLPPCHLQLPFPCAQVALGWRHGLALAKGTGTVISWGCNDFGQLGAPHSASAPLLPLPKVTPVSCETGFMLDLHSVVAAGECLHVSAGAENSAALSKRGGVLSWGWNEHGQLGLGSTADSQSPQVVEGVGPCEGVTLGSGFGVAW